MSERSINVYYMCLRNFPKESLCATMNDRIAAAAAKKNRKKEIPKQQKAANCTVKVHCTTLHRTRFTRTTTNRNTTSINLFLFFFVPIQLQHKHKTPLRTDLPHAIPYPALPLPPTKPYSTVQKTLEQ